MRTILEQRVRDGVIRRSIDKWLKAGVLEAGALWYPDAGTPQGGVISPLLANVYLHEVLDVWFEQEVKPRLEGKAILVRYADDVAIAFALQTDARRVLDVLPKRFGRYGLTLHPEKTRLVDFRRPTDSGGKRGTFDLLGFTHFWGLSRKGNWVVQRKTSRSSFGRALMRISEWCRKSRHLAVRDQHQALVLKLRGHYSYFGIVGNGRSLGRFFHETQRAWRKWLHRRSDSARMWWNRFKLLLERYPLPVPRVVHRLAAKPVV